MTELTTSQLIKIILGIFVVVAVVIGVFLFFKGNVIDFFKNLPGTEEPSGGAGASKEIGEEVEGETLEIPGEEGEEETDLSCEESDCTSTLPEELSCRLGNVFGYLHKCSRGECVRTRVKKKIYDCEFGCTDGECDVSKEEEAEEEIPEEEDEEETDLSCEESDCTSTLPEELSCRLGNVFGYLHKCSRGECVRTRVKKKIYDCEFGCTDGECDACLPTGTIIGKNVLVIGTPSGSCCDEAYCAERGFLGMCKEYKCG